MRTLVLSDIHGNIDALLAIEEPCDSIIVLGDLVDYGPKPAECVAFLMERDVIRARGNHDHAVAFCVDCHTPQGPLRQLSMASREFTAQVLSDAEKAWLGQAETYVALEQDGRRIFACHGAPSNHMYKYLAPHMPEAELAQELAAAKADIVFVGHTHLPFMKKIDGRLLVNVGSVGQPRDGVPQISYALMENGEVELRRAPYDVEAAVAKVREMPLAALMQDQLSYLLEQAKAPPVE